MTSVSFSSIHHSFDISIATEYGIEEAILIHHFQHWIRINRSLKRNLIDGRVWMYQTQDEIAAHFPYLNKFKVFRCIQKLIELGVIMTGNFNKNKYDQTKWYAFVNEGKWLPFIERLQNCNIENTNLQHRDYEIATPIPNTKTYTKTNEEHPPNPPQGGRSREACGAFVKLTKEEKEKLEDTYGSQIVDQLIEEINDYLASTGKKPYKDYAAAIRQWARRRGIQTIKKEVVQPTGEKKIVEKVVKTASQEDSEWLGSLQSAHNLENSERFKAYGIFKFLITNQRIDISHGGINFLELPEGKFYYGEPGFRHKVESALRKLNITVAT